MTDAQFPKREITRREFCNGLLITSTGLLIAATVPGTEAGAHHDAALAYPPVKIQGAESMLPGSALNFTYPRASDPAILVREVDGEYYAYGKKCSHMGCSIYFERETRRLVCPCHKGAYAAQTGFVLMGPPPRPLNMIVLQMRAGGEVWAVGRGTPNL